MYFVLLVAALAILAGVVVVAMGRGGEIARFDRDLPTTPPRIRAASDLPLLRLPIGLFGYQEQATREALDAAARLLAEQDAEIARLRDEVTRLGAGVVAPGEPGAGLRRAVSPGEPVAYGPAAGGPVAYGPAAGGPVAGQTWP